MSERIWTGRTPEAAMQDPELAISGGSRLLDALAPAPKPDLSAALASITATLEGSGTAFVWYGGPEQRRFEAEFAELVGAEHAVLCSSGTSALHMCLHLLGVGPATVIGIPSFGFYSCVTTAMQLGARIKLLPVDPETLVVTPASCGSTLDECSVLLAVHALGNAVDVPALQALHPHLVVLEDAAEAQGTTLDGAPVGRDGVAACWSLTTTHNELHAAAVAGVVTTDDRAIADRCRRLAHYGKDHRSVTPGTGLNPPPAELGFNYMSTEVEAAVARATLAAFPSAAARRRAIGDLLAAGLQERGYWTIGIDPRCATNRYDVVFGLPDVWAPHREWVLRALLAEGASAWTYHSLAGMGWLEEWMRERGWWGQAEEQVRASDQRLIDRLVAFRPSMAEDEIEPVLRCVDKVLGR